MAPPTKRKDGKDKEKKKKIIKRVKEVVFDEDARKDYLTGFSKRKKARELVARVKAIDREREDKNENRREVRNERKERAALNVRNAKELYGDADELEDKLDFDSSDDEQVKKRSQLKAKKSVLNSDDEEGSNSDEESNLPKKKRKHALDQLENETIFESSNLISTVIIEPFSLSRESSPEFATTKPKKVFDAEGNAIYAVNPDGNKSSKSGIDKGKKRVKNKPAMRMKMSRSDKRERATGGKKEVRERGAGTGTKSSRK